MTHKLATRITGPNVVSLLDRKTVLDAGNYLTIKAYLMQPCCRITRQGNAVTIAYADATTAEELERVLKEAWRKRT